MAKPLVVSFSHELGRAEAINRIRNGIEYLKANYASKVSIVEDTWTGDRLDFAVRALKQTAAGFVEVEDERVTLSITLPLLLAMMAEKVQSLIQKEGTLLLEKK